MSAAARRSLWRRSHRMPPPQERYREAKALAGALEMRPLLAHCHLGLGRLSIHAGDHQRAQRHLEVATTMYREMDMRLWLEKAKEEMTKCV